MGPTVTFLMAIGFFLVWVPQAQPGPLPRPSLRAEPGLMIPWGEPVTLWCEGPPGADQYRLRKEGGDLDMEKSADGRGARDHISYMGAKTAGRYQCLYRKQWLWSEASDPLVLRVTGLYDAPSLSAVPSSQVTSGHNVTLQCWSQLGYDSSALYKDGGEITHGGAQSHGRGAQTNFLLPAVTPAHGGTYRCCSFHSTKPYVWSLPSGPLVLRVTDPLPRPSLRAEPGLVIPLGKSVTLRCEVLLRADLYSLRKEGGGDLNMETSVDGRGAQSLISNMGAENAGRYQCLYRKQWLWSEASDPLVLILSDLYHPPSLSALPSSQVASGQNVTLQCQSHRRYNSSALQKDGGEITYGDPQSHGWKAQTNFSLLAVTPAHGGAYRCYSFDSTKPYVWTLPSDPLVLRVTDPFSRPSLRAEPGLMIPRGKPVTLWCEGPLGADRYQLRKEGAELDMEKSGDGRGAQLLISNMGAENAGRYQCFYMNQSLWLEAGDPLELRVTGLYDAPSLSAVPSSQVASGQEVTLQCRSRVWYDKSALVKDGEKITYGGGLVHGRGVQTNFSLPTVTPAHGGAYRCYSFDSTKPYVWSAPSDPLVLKVTDAPGLSRLQVGILMGGSLFLILLLLLLFLCHQCWCHRTRHRNGGTEAEATVTPRSSDPAETPLDEILYAVLNMDRQTEEVAPRGEDPQKVTYAKIRVSTGPLLP